MIFTYWTAGVTLTEQSMPEEAIAAWTSRFPDFTVFSDEQVLPLLEPWGREVTNLFQDIRIPACRSDVARLVLLRTYGGLYVDADCGPGAGDRLTLLFERLSRYELIVFDESVDKPQYRHTCITTGALVARANTGVLDTLIRNALSNLAQHREKELSSVNGRADYTIYKLTGPWMIWHELFQPATLGGELKSQYRDRVSIWPYDRSECNRPVLTDRHNSYRTPKAHWSRREKTEPLFLSSED
jgi:hypothetical protein